MAARGDHIDGSRGHIHIQYEVVAHDGILKGGRKQNQPRKMGGVLPLSGDTRLAYCSSTPNLGPRDPRMPSQHTAHVFIDANVLLHFLRPDQIDWCTLTKADAVILVGAPVLLRELEKHKVHNKSRTLRERSLDLVKWLAPFIDDPEQAVRPGARWFFLPHDPLIDFVTHNLSRDVSDDHLIASVMVYKPSTHDPVFVATDDIGLRAKIKFRQIDVLSLPDSMRRPAELDPFEQEHKRLRAENEKLKNRIPKLSVTFPDGRAFQDIYIEERRNLGAPSLEAVKRRHPLAELAEDGAAAGSLQNAPTPLGWARMQKKMFAIPENRVKAYNEALADYYGRYQKYLLELEDYQEKTRLSAQIGIVIANKGTAPATRIDLMLTFPEWIRLTAIDDDAPQEPEPPIPPPRPTPADELLRANMRNLGMSLTGQGTWPAALNALSRPIRWEGDPNITLDGQSVRFRLVRLQHGAREPVEAFVMRFIGPQNVRSFSIQYRISADEIPEPITDKIHIRVKGNDK